MGLDKNLYTLALVAGAYGIKDGADALRAAASVPDAYDLDWSAAEVAEMLALIGIPCMSIEGPEGTIIDSLQSAADGGSMVLVRTSPGTLEGGARWAVLEVSFGESGSLVYMAGVGDVQHYRGKAADVADGQAVLMLLNVRDHNPLARGFNWGPDKN